MTADLIRQLSAIELADLYGSLHATQLPQGSFTGRAWSFDLPFVDRVSRVWQGKVFEGDTVWNRILGRLAVPGMVALNGDRVVITYPQLGVTDTLKLITDELLLGR